MCISNKSLRKSIFIIDFYELRNNDNNTIVKFFYYWLIFIQNL